jgi:glycosyltransferase involved in cell wall biosynthesis
MLGYVDHRTAIGEMVGADALFLPMHDIPSGRRARIVPGKTYEYLASGRPILAAVPPGDGRDLIVEMDAGRIADPTDVDGLARAIVSLAADAPTPRRVPAGIEQFERRRLAARLAELLLEL